VLLWTGLPFNGGDASKIIELLERNVKGWTREELHIRCISHIINLVAPKILQTLKAEFGDDDMFLVEGCTVDDS
jgi:hypothetical protein